jgi:hypothetical protein
MMATNRRPAKENTPETSQALRNEQISPACV